MCLFARFSEISTIFLGYTQFICFVEGTAEVST